MSVPFSLRFTRKAIFLPLLLMCLWLPSHLCSKSILIVNSGSYPLIKRIEESQNVITNLTNEKWALFEDFNASSGNVAFYFIEESGYLNFSVLRFRCEDSVLKFIGDIGKGSTLTIKEGQFSFKNEVKSFAISMSFKLNETSSVYITDVTISKSLFSTRTVLSLFHFDKNTLLIPNTTLFLHNVTTFASDRMIMVQESGLAFESVIVTQSSCFSCRWYFYVESHWRLTARTLIFDSCQNSEGAPFIGDFYPLNWTTTEHLVLSNISTKGGIFGVTPTEGFTLPTGARVTLYNVTAGSLYQIDQDTPLFASIPVDAQVYVGPMTIGGKRLTTPADFDAINLPFTKAIDLNRKVLAVRQSEVAGPYSDNAKVGEFAASHCNKYYLKGIDQVFNPETDEFRGDCMCKDSTYRPYCLNAYFPYSDTICSFGYTHPLGKELTETCVGCKIDQCGRCDEVNKCAHCVKGYAVDDANQCSIPITGCLTPSNADPKRCTTCDTDYSLTEKRRCVPTIDDCTTYAETGQCTECNGDLVPSKNGSSCIVCPPIEHCVMCSAYDKCSTCDTDYSLSVESQCVPTIDDCTTYAESGQCTQCNGDLVPSKDGASCIVCPLENCKQCRTHDQCSTCEAKYSLVEGNCVSCGVDQCLRCEEADKCKKCAVGYDVAPSGKCGFFSGNCFRHEENTGTCFECKEGLSLSWDKYSCVSCTMKNCQACSEDEKCAVCESGYAVDDANQCSILITGCLTPSNADPKRCTTCDTDYSLTVESQCVPTIDDCTTYAESGQCTECSGDLVPSKDGASCIVCPPIEHCVMCSAYDKCSTCDTDYSLSVESQCVPTIDDCTTYAESGQCTECSGDLVPSKDGASCIPCPLENCVKCSTYDKCNECTSDYDVAHNSKCERFVEGCFRRDASAPCEDCKEGLSVSMEMDCCVACPEGCNVCNNKGVCQKCNDDYTMTSDYNCIECKIPNCLSCSAPNICETCIPDPTDENDPCIYNGEKQDNDKGSLWWVWLIVGLAAAVVVGVVLFFVVRYCCRDPQEFHVTYQDKGSMREKDGESLGERSWDSKGESIGTQRVVVLVSKDPPKPPTYTPEGNRTAPDTNHFDSTDYTSSSADMGFTTDDE